MLNFGKKDCCLFPDGLFPLVAVSRLPGQNDYPEDTPHFSTESNMKKCQTLMWSRKLVM